MMPKLLVKKYGKNQSFRKWVENVCSVAENPRGHKVVLDLGTASGGDNKGP